MSPTSFNWVERCQTRSTWAGPASSPGWRPREWSLRRKVALAVLIPIALAAVFGGLRVRNDLAEADNYSASRRAGHGPRARRRLPRRRRERRRGLPRQKTTVDEPARDAAVAEVDAAGAWPSRSRSTTPDLTEHPARVRRVGARPDRGQLRSERRLRQSPAQSVARAAPAPEQCQPADRHDRRGADRAGARGSSCSTRCIGGRISLAIQQFAVADDNGRRSSSPTTSRARSASRPPPSSARAVLGGNDPDVSDAARAERPPPGEPSATAAPTWATRRRTPPYDSLNDRDARRHRPQPGRGGRRVAERRPASTRSSRWPRCSPRSSWRCWSRACCSTRSAGCARARSRSPRSGCPRRSG